MPPRELREVLQKARPSWTEQNLDAVELRLADVGIKSTEALEKALKQQRLNVRLRRANLKTFTAETVRDLRHAFGLRCRTPEPQNAASEQEVQRDRPGWFEVLQKARVHDGGNGNGSSDSTLTDQQGLIEASSSVKEEDLEKCPCGVGERGSAEDSEDSSVEIIDVPDATLEEMDRNEGRVASFSSEGFLSKQGQQNEAHEQDWCTNGHEDSLVEPPLGAVAVGLSALKAKKETSVPEPTNEQQPEKVLADEGASQHEMEFGGATRQVMCSGCGNWPASSDPADNGAGYCDNCWFKWEGAMQPLVAPKFREVQLVRTAKDMGLRFSPLPSLSLRSLRMRPGELVVVVDPSVRYQTFLGFGGAFTESSAQVFKKLNKKNQDSIINSYFHAETGLGYRFGRLHMTSCDFSDGNWTCCDEPLDAELETFSLERFKEAIFPMLRKAQDASGKPLLLLASPWSPPGWMKASGCMCRKGDRLLPEFREAWAKYFVRFAQEMKAEGWPLWGMTVQNEPENVDVVWETCVFTAQEERNFLSENLGPALAGAGLLQELRLLIWDHNRDNMVERAQVIYKDPTAASYAWGLGFHWYGDDPSYKNVQYVHDMFPDKHLVHTEGCVEGGPWIGDWRIGEVYAHHIINDLNHWADAWIDWNLVLDETGGPNHAKNFCSAPVIADTGRDCVLFQPAFYYIGHFSRHVQPGAARISCSIRGARAEGTASDPIDLNATAFANPDGTIVVVVLNIGEETYDFALSISGSAARASAPEHSITTFTLRNMMPPSRPASSGDCSDTHVQLQQKYCIAGTWDDWRGVHPMMWDSADTCFHFVVQLGSEGWVSFQILVNGRWKTTLYPDEADGSFHSGSALCGPDECNHGRNWTIGRHPLDRGGAGACYKVRLFLSANGQPERVDWVLWG